MRRFTIPLLTVFILALPAKAAVPAGASVRSGLATQVKGNNQFALDLYGRLRQKPGNLFCSPHGVSTALAMTYAGAKGETAEQMAKVLRFRLGHDQLHPTFAELTRELNGHGLPRDYQLHVANSLWGARDIRFRSDFQDLIKANYGARIRPVDFAGQPELARQLINRWVEERTHEKIKELLQSPDITGNTALVLVNAIYFKAAWEHPFQPSATRKDIPFQVAGGKSVPVAMMNQTEQFNYLEGDTFQALELPYEGRELSLVVLLPKEKVGLDKLENTLTAEMLDASMARMKPQRVAVALPKFRLASRFDLWDVLSDMGMPLAFGRGGAADFSGMAQGRNLGAISKVIHQAQVDLSEEGTEAAAATAVIFPRSAAKEPATFRADHSFLFLLRDTHTGAILFLGRLTDPIAGAAAQN